MLIRKLKKKIQQYSKCFTGLRSLKQDEGLTLIELLVVVAILGIIAAIAIPSVAGAMQNAKIGATEATMSTVQEALQRYEVDFGNYPSNLSTLMQQTTAKGTTDGPFLSSQTLVDAWGNQIGYEFVAPSGNNPGEYILFSNEGNNSNTNQLSSSSSNVIWASGGISGTSSIGQTPTTSPYPASFPAISKFTISTNSNSGN